MDEAKKHRVVLLAEDEVLIRNLVRRSLEMAGFAVLAAADAAEALELSRSCPDQIDAIIADVEMPGMDGITLAKQVTEERADTLVLLMSAGTSRPIPEQMAFIAKPFSPTELTAKLEAVLGVEGDNTGSSC